MELLQYRFSDEYHFHKNNHHYLQKNSPQCEWHATSERNTYVFFVDSIRSIHLYGRIIINEQDTLLIENFEKGSIYPSWYRHTKTGSEGMFFLDFNDVNSDSLWLERPSDSLFFDQNLLFLRRERNSGH